MMGMGTGMGMGKRTMMTRTSKNAMNNTPTRQILVALDSCNDSRPALLVAGEMAAALRAELSGLFIEDEELANVASLPFSRVIHSYSGASANLDLTSLRRQMRVKSNRVRQALEQSASQWQVEHSFRIIRGKIGDVLLDQAKGADLVSIGSRNWRLGGSMRLGECACLITQQVGKSVLLLPSNGHKKRHLMAIIDNAQNIEKLLQPLVQLCRNRGEAPLVVVTTGHQQQELQQSIIDYLHPLGIRANIIYLPGTPAPSTLKKLVQDYQVRLLIVNAGAFAENSDQLQQMIQTIDTATLLVN